MKDGVAVVQLDRARDGVPNDKLSSCLMLMGSFTCKLRRQQCYLLEQVTVAWTYRAECDVEEG